MKWREMSYERFLRIGRKKKIEINNQKMKKIRRYEK